VKPLTSILLVLDRSGADESLIARALALARASSARIDLFACDAVHEYELRRAFVARGVEAARQASVEALCTYLRRVAERLAPENLAVSIEAVSDTPLYESIVHKVLGSRPDLVMKAAATEISGGHAKVGLNDWQLVRLSPVPLLLGRGRAWPERPRFAAVVDVSEEETPGLAARILALAEQLRAACGGVAIDVLFGERAGTAQQVHEAHAETLRRLAGAAHVDASSVQLLTGDPAIALTRAAARQQYDALVLGALTHREPITPLVGTLTRKLMETLDCDFVLVKGAAP
jgi:nucleotide-binding universal stress UspA family protein